MPSLEITDDDDDRIDALRDELEATNAGPYASVDRGDVVAYLLDLADAVDDPERRVAVDDPDRRAAIDDPDRRVSDEGLPAPDGDPFPREKLRSRLEARNRKHGDPDAEPRMDLYTIAAEYDVAGRSGMTKAELVEAIVDAVDRLRADPLHPIDVDLDEPDPDDASHGDPAVDEVDREDAAAVVGDDGTTDDETSDGAGAAAAVADDGDGTAAAADATADTDATANDGGSGQLNAMLSLLDTHADKWRDGDGDARYEVDLPDGSVETARTKDDVRAILFKKY